tara:strand:- start:39983 stop:40606 length:624 start_codon:yes stop_codon:yes gene_type:complete
MILRDNHICILDYGSGNVMSVFNLVKKITDNVTISNAVNDIKLSSHIILPGVGAFGEVMNKMKATLPLKILQNEVVTHQKPFLGICVGMQVLSDCSTEFGQHEGLGWIPGTVDLISSDGQPLPHVGWNDIDCRNSHRLFNKLPQDIDFYFVHKYGFKTKSKEHTLATTNYGESFASVIGKDNIYGVQFHPEKSQLAGESLVSNFLLL